MYQWLTVGHLVGVILWIGCMAATYWMLRFHTHAPASVHEKLILMERSLALAMDLGAALAIGCGITMALMSGNDGDGSTFRSPYTHGFGNLFAAKGGPGSIGPGWFHIKLLFVIAGVLSVHGILRAKVGKFSRGQSPKVPEYLWTVLLLSVVAVIIAVTILPAKFARKLEKGDKTEKSEKIDRELPPMGESKVKIAVYSFGEDKTENTADDVRSWAAAPK
jgi:uncharacterized membrane protein